MKINLDACPFCGGKGRITAYTTNESEVKYYVYCETCGVFSPHFDSAAECEGWWNTRVYPERDAKLIQQRYCKHERCNHCFDDDEEEPF